MTAKSLFSLHAIAAQTILVAVLPGCSGAPSTLRQPSLPYADRSSHGATDRRGSPSACQKNLSIRPSTASIHVGQVQLLTAYVRFPYQQWCYDGPGSAMWSAPNGGTLKVINNGTQAEFSSSKAGHFTVNAIIVRWFLSASASINVEQ